MIQYSNTAWLDYLKENDIHIPRGEKKILIVEGVDASGKSTMIDILLDLIKHSFLLHTSAPPRGKGEEYYQKILSSSLSLFENLEQPVIVDRFHIGESVYGEIFRGYQFDHSKLDKELFCLKAKMIYVKANNETIVERINRRGDWYIQTKDVEILLSKYEKEISKTKLPTFVLDTTNDIQQKDIKDLIRFIYED